MLCAKGAGVSIYAKSCRGKAQTYFLCSVGDKFHAHRARVSGDLQDKTQVHMLSMVKSADVNPLWFQGERVYWCQDVSKTVKGEVADGSLRQSELGSYSGGVCLR